MARRKAKNGRVLPDGVSERADGRFIYRYMVYGKPHYIYDRDLNSLKKKILQKKVDMASGRNVDYDKLTLGEWYPQYLKLYKENKIKESTMRNYVNYYNWYIKGELIDRMPIKELRRSHVVAHFQMLADKKKLAHGTLRALASMLYNCFQRCIYDGIIGLNPAANVMEDIIATPKELRDALTVEETRVLIDFLKREGEWQNVYLPLIAIGLSTGLRIGELTGLTWKDVDLKNNMIDVNHTLSYRDKGNGHEFFITTPKTQNSVRRIPMTKEVRDLFIMQKEYQSDMKIRSDIEINGYHHFVFTTKVGNPYTHEGIVNTLDTIVKRANEMERERAEEEERKPVIVPRHTPHVWRHTFCTRLVEKQIPYEDLKILMGHSSIRTTIDVYTHITQQNLKRVHMELDEYIGVL